MGNHKKEIQSILERYRLGTASEEDIAFLEDWYMLHDHSKETNDEYSATELINDADDVWKKLNHRTPTIIKFVKYAAAILLIASIALYLNRTLQPSKDLNIESIVATNDLEPTITLSDGTIIALDKAQQGIKMGDGIKYENGSLVNGITQGTKPQELLIQIPAGSTYQITLSDNTKVWLNSGSSLKYPSYFEGDLRTVELEGEAYFEVKSQLLDKTAKRKAFVRKEDYASFSYTLLKCKFFGHFFFGAS